MPSVVVSVVSHRHAELVGRLLADLDLYCPNGYDLSVILTLNVEEPLPFGEDGFGFPLKVIRNTERKGFGANHNAAFRVASGDYFCVLNPDILLHGDPFPRLMQALGENRSGVVAPMVVGADGLVEDNARRFPTPLSILGKALGARRRDYSIGQKPFAVDWIAGMFMLFPSRVFAELGGFNTRYFLYYEDVDLCARAREAGYAVVLDPRVAVVHEARRESHRNLYYMKLHLASMIKFFLSRFLAAGKRRL